MDENEHAHASEVEEEKKAGLPPKPAGPPHDHPAVFQWSHTLHSRERRPPNFGLNGDHAQYNEEKLTPLF